MTVYQSLFLGLFMEKSIPNEVITFGKIFVIMGIVMSLWQLLKYKTVFNEIGIQLMISKLQHNQ